MEINGKRSNYTYENNIFEYKINLKNLENLMSNYKKGKKKINDDLHETIRKKGKNIFNSIDKSLRKEKYDKVDEENEEICEKIMMIEMMII